MPGTIRVTRAKDLWVNRARRFNIWINGEKVGTIRRGETLDFPVPAGRFTLWASIDWTGSPTLEGVMGEGEVRNYLVGNGASAVGLVDTHAYLNLVATD